MWIVRLALRRPYSVGVFSALILIMGILSIKSMLVDIFPTIDIPVVMVVWNYNGLSAEEMEKRVVVISERSISTTVNGVEKIESESVPGIGLMKIYFQPGTDIGAAIAQISSVSSTILRIAPPGMQPPVIIQYNASNVPVAQLTMESKTLSEAKIFDYALNFIRIRLFTIPGLATPAPFGGKQRQIIVDVDPNLMAAKGISPMDVVTALQTSNVILPAGVAHIGNKEYNVTLNSSPDNIADFNNIPIKVVNGQPVTMGDVAKISDGFSDQTNIVRVNGKRSAYLTILKKANASTLAVVEGARSVIPIIKETAPDGLELHVDFDQSVFVKSAIESVLHEGVTASILVSLMILFFLGSWRSVIVIITSIPLSILVSVIGLKLTGNSLNIMTLGGLSLAIGMLVDDATVEVENIHRNRNMGKPLTLAILDGANQIATPALVATLSICIVFFPVVLLTGPARFLFTPMALAVVIAMMASYVLSRTLVPTLSRMLMAGEKHGILTDPSQRVGFWDKFNHARDSGFDRFRERYGKVLHVMLEHKWFTISIAGLVLVVSLFLVRIIGTDFFPTTDTGLMKLHFRAPSGTRLEETEKLVAKADDQIRKIIPAEELSTINDMIGMPTFYNLAFVRTDNTSSMDADISIALKPNHRPTVEYMQKIREQLPEVLPGCQVYFQPADIVSQVLNFGLSSPIDVQIENRDYNASYAVAKKLQAEMQKIPGTADVHIRQILDYPTINVDVDRVKAAEMGLTQRDVANNMLISLSSSSLVSPSFFVSPENGVNYTVAVKVPLNKINSVQNLMSTPITPGASQLNQSPTANPTDVPASQTQTLGNLSTVNTGIQANLISHYTVQRVMDINANVEGRDLGTVADKIQQAIDKIKPDLPKGMHITLRGQSEVMNQSFSTLGLGIILAIALVYLLMVVLFQSWIDPFIIMIAVPGAFIGILWMLVITGTTINVVSLMGAIVAIGIAVSNSILLVSFANEIRGENPDLTPLEAALEAGKTRLRPVLMTAIAMILGMIPMALGTGAGGEQNAPLGRAVIGGLTIATFVTLFVVPVIYSALRKKVPTMHLMDKKFEEEAAGKDITH